jgi:hypothetical protein
VAGGFTGHGDVYSTVTALDQALGDRPPDPTGRTGDGSRRVPATERTTTPPTFIPRMPVGPARRQPV